MRKKLAVWLDQTGKVEKHLLCDETVPTEAKRGSGSLLVASFGEDGSIEQVDLLHRFRDGSYDTVFVHPLQAGEAGHSFGPSYPKPVEFA